MRENMLFHFTMTFSRQHMFQIYFNLKILNYYNDQLKPSIKKNIIHYYQLFMAHKPIPPNVFVIISIDDNYQYRALLGHEMNGVKRTNNKPLTTNCFLTNSILLKCGYLFILKGCCVSFFCFPRALRFQPSVASLFPLPLNINSVTLHAWYLAMLAKTVTNLTCQEEIPTRCGRC